MSSKLLSEIIQNLRYACDFTRENVPIDERAEEAKEKLKNKNRQTSLNDFFTPK